MSKNDWVEKNRKINNCGGGGGGLLETVAWRQWRIQRLPDAGIPAWAPKLCAQIKKKLMQNNINYLIISSACTPSQTPFNLKSNVLEIVELKTLSIPVPATQFCLNVSQSIVCKKNRAFT